MGSSYYTIGGWKGLTNKGKFNAVVIFLFIAIILFFVFKLFYYGRFDFDFKVMNNLLSYSVALFGAWIITRISMFFLEKVTYLSTEYFCADCGNYLGNSPTSCDRCGCNRYTESDTGVGRTVRNR